MAITTMDGLAAAVAASQDMVLQKASALTSVAAFWYSLFAEAGNPAAGTLTIGNTANGVVPTDNTAGAAIINPFTGANTGYLAAIRASATATQTLVLYDRIFHSGSYATTPTGTTTLSSQPSFSGRVQDGTDFGGCEIWLEINTAIAASAVTIQVGYQDGTAAGGAAQTTTVTASLSGYPTKRMIQLGMANGSGVQRINSFIVGGTAAATGSINVVVVRKIATMPIMVANLGAATQDFFALGGQLVFADSCLCLMSLATGTALGTIVGDCQIING
jgi:hypothetical protein